MTTRDQQSRRSAVDVDVVKAIGHPLRLQLLTRLNERVASPVELARELDESVQLVSYHVRILRDLGFVELVSTTPRRGAIEHHYRAIRRAMFSDEDFAALPVNARGTIAGATLEELISHAANAHEHGMFEQTTNANISTGDIVIDQEGWDTLADRVKEIYDLALELQAEAIPRIQGGAESLTAHLSVLLYPAPDPSATPAVPLPAKRPRRRKS